MFEDWLFARLLSRVHHYHLTAEGDDNPGGGSGGDQGGADPADGGGNAGDTPGDQGTGLASLAEDGGAAATPADWPADWRERLAGEDEAALRELKRFGSPGGLWKKIANQEKIIRSGGHKAPLALPENPTEEQVAEYRKALGVPETPDGYGVQFAPELAADDGLQTMLQSYLAYAHERNLPPAAVKAAVEWQQGEILRQREEQTAAVARERARVTAELRKEYGADYKRNLALADEFLSARPGLAKLVRADNPDLDLVRDIIALARDTAPEDVLYSGDAESGGRSLDDQIKELTDKSIRGKLSKAEDEKYNRLLNARLQRQQRQQRNRAA